MIEIVNSSHIKLPFSTCVVPDVTTDDEPCYMAYHLELEGCMSHGQTPEEALQNLYEVTEIYLSTLVEMGIELPKSQGMKLTWYALTEPEETLGTEEVSNRCNWLPSFVSHE